MPTATLGADAQAPEVLAPLQRLLEVPRPVQHRLGARPQGPAQVAELQPLADAVEQSGAFACV